MAWQPDSDMLAISGTDLALYAVENNAFLHEIVSLERELKVSEIFGIAWSPDGKRLSEVGEKFQVWDIAAQSFTSFTHQRSLSAVAWSLDGTKLLTGNVDGNVQIWDANTTNLLATLSGHSRQINTLTWSSDGSKLASGSYDGTIRIWDAKTGANLESLELLNPIYSIAWRPNSDEIAFGGSDKNIYIWNTTDPAPQTTFEAAEHWLSISAIAWSPDGKYLASASGSVLSTWDVSTGQRIEVFQGHTGAIDSISWNSDGSEIASVGKDHTLRIWNSSTGETLIVYTL